MPVRKVDTPTEAVQYLQCDAHLSEVIDRHGPLQLEPAEDTFRRVIVSVLRQQVSMESAEATRERLFEAFEITPSSLASADPEALHDVGLSRQKAQYVQNISEAYLQHDYGHEYFADMSDEEVASELTDIKGVGSWTAKMYLQFALGRKDIFPVEDLGIRKSMESLYDVSDRQTMVDKAQDWKPYRSIASLYLWRHGD